MFSKPPRNERFFYFQKPTTKNQQPTTNNQQPKTKHQKTCPFQNLTIPIPLQKIKMKGNITVASSWSQLNDWQIAEIAHLYLNTDPADFPAAYQKMILIVYQKSLQKEDVKLFKQIIAEIPISELEKHTRYLLETTNFHRFPEIEGLQKPADRLQNITIHHFSTIDTFFHYWFQDRTTLHIKRLVASLYLINTEFDEIDLPKVDAITRHIPVKQMEAIALAFWFTKMYITEKFPIVFPKPEPEVPGELKPIFKKQTNEYVPFDKAILGLAMDDLQPLGKKQDINKVRIYEFFSVWSESILYNKAKQKANEKK